MESFDFMIPKQKLIVCRFARKMPAVVELQSIHEKSSQGTVLTFSFLQRFTIRGSKVLFRHLLVPTSHTPVLRHSTDWRSKRYHSFNKDLTLGYLRAMTGCERLVAQRFQRKTLSSPVVFDTRWRWLFPLNLQSPEGQFATQRRKAWRPPDESDMTRAFPGRSLFVKWRFWTILQSLADWTFSVRTFSWSEKDWFIYAPHFVLWDVHAKSMGLSQFPHQWFYAPLDQGLRFRSGCE